MKGMGISLSNQLYKKKEARCWGKPRPRIRRKEDVITTVVRVLMPLRIQLLPTIAHRAGIPMHEIECVCVSYVLR